MAYQVNLTRLAEADAYAAYEYIFQQSGEALATNLPQPILIQIHRKLPWHDRFRNRKQRVGLRPKCPHFPAGGAISASDM